MSRQAQVAEFKKKETIEAAKPMIPKLINREKINVKKSDSLFDRQRNILVQAQMQHPVKTSELKDSTMQKTRFKDWLIDEVGDKVDKLETVAQP